MVAFGAADEVSACETLSRKSLRTAIVDSSARGFPPRSAVPCQQIRAVSRPDLPRWQSLSLRPGTRRVCAENHFCCPGIELARSGFGTWRLLVTAKKSRQFPNGCALPAVSRLVAQRKLGFRCGVNPCFRRCPFLWRYQSEQGGVVLVLGYQSLAELPFQFLRW